MDLLRSPGGCPWDAAQTHESLVPFALEEAHEVAEAIELGDRAGMREELGDLLLQVVFHARLAQEHPSDAFDLDDVARGVAAKLVRRHPHVFDADGSLLGEDAGAEGGPTAEPESADVVHARWDRIKKVEKQRTSVLDGIPLAQGALARGQKVLSRARRGGLMIEVDAVARQHDAATPAGLDDSALDDSALDDRALDDRGFGARLLLLAAEAELAGVDAEAALRSALRTLEDAVRASEAG
ncbi:nucleoside triphosphate pyrophosphohydrolase [Pengzhenrongella frigida]|uniref:Nucleoside triphosphate pyrophosphohydrolase n=2 Tax=Pengzhenrongella frigida TaxID=1259133 RepID=A0A4Q5MWM9_9MICO|nr:nucleoside triphosphate pyrophosphohydrolase [Cellulomonas sp. HLT2-17]